MRSVLRIFAAIFVPLLLALPARAGETKAERLANTYATQELAAAPPGGNLPDYSLPPAELAKAQHIAAVHHAVHFADELWGVLQPLLLLWLGAIAWMQGRAQRAGRSRWLQSYTFLLLFLLAGLLLDLPIGIFDHALSLRYGLSIQRWGSWAGDLAKSFVLEWLIGGLILMLLFWVIRRFPNRWWLVFWCFTLPLTMFGLFIGPYVEPLFFHYEPLGRTQPALVARLEQVAQRGHMNIPPDRMFLMQASAKLTTLNADVEGFGHSKRVVVWDNTLRKMTPDEILFVFGHESGHYVLGHIVRGLLLSFAGSFVLLYLGFRFVRWALGRFGPRWGIAGQGDWGALAVLVLAFALFNVVLEPVTANLSRHQEHAADVYGQEAVHGIVADPQATARGAFDVLGETSLDDPNPSRFIEFWTYGHPATGRRAAFGRAYNPWAPGLSPKYFPKP
jgi:STE24 endopeptidase